MWMSSWTVAHSQDLDADGIPDLTEHQLLERYRPFFLFAHGEDFNPTDVKFYINSSDLLRKGDEGSTPLIGNDQLAVSPNLVLTANLTGNQYCSDTGPGSGAVHL